MNYKDIMTLLIVFLVFTIIGTRIAEVGMYSVMGLDIAPKSFSFDVIDNRLYTFDVMGKNYSLQKVYKIGNFYANRYKIAFDINGKRITLYPIISSGVTIKGRINLDKRHANMYN